MPDGEWFPGRRWVVAAVVSGAFFGPACLCGLEIQGLGDGGRGADTKLDAGDGGTGEDAGVDAGRDGGGDAGPDAGVDAGQDGGFDAGVDAGPIDAGLCVPSPSTLAATATYDYSGYPTPHTRGLGVQDMVSGDLDGDGILDLVAQVVWPFAGVDVFLGLSDGGLSAPVFYRGDGGGEPNTGEPNAMTLGDLNRDGRLDLMTSSNIQLVPQPDGGTIYESQLSIYLNRGDGTLDLVETDVVSKLIDTIAIADLDGDGIADLVLNGVIPTGVPPAWTAAIEVLYGQPGGGFGAPVEIPGLEGAYFGALVVADLNDDGFPDLVASDSDGGVLEVLLNQGDGGFDRHAYSIEAPDEAVLLPTPGSPPGLFAIYYNQTGYGSGAVQPLRNDGAADFEIGPVYPVTDPAWSTVGDFNGDCIPDLAISGFACGPGPTCTPWLWVLYGEADGGFAAPQSLKAFGATPAGMALLGPVEHPRALAVGDYGGAGITVYGDTTRN